MQLKSILASIFMLFIYNASLAQSDSRYAEVMSKTAAVDDPDKQVGNFDPSTSPSLPIGLVKVINDKKYIIAIDSAYFLDDAAYFSAYMAIEFANSNKKIAFAAKNIQFNPEGVLGGDQAKLMLVSDHLIDLGPNTRLSLKGDGSNYVNWNCNGFESVNLKGDFLISGQILQPANDVDSCVTAGFEVNIEDINNMMASVSFSPFTISGLDDFDFSVSSAYVDMNDYGNPAGVAMPTCYSEIYPDDINLWRGFYIQNFTVTLPEKMSQADERTAIYARDMFIDDAGVTGFFGASNVLNLRDGETGGKWGFSVDSLEVGLTTNALTSGLMAGEMEIPLMDNNAIEYVALISKNDATNKADYYFSINTEDSVDVSCFSSTLELYPTTELEMTVVDDLFKPKLTLNGSWTLDRENAKFRGIGFQQLVVIPEAPYVSSGLFSLVQGEADTTDVPASKMAKFNISINQLSLGVLNGKPTIASEVALNFGDPEKPTNISVTSGFKVTAGVNNDPVSDRQKWEIDRFSINTIAIKADVNAFHLDGAVDFRKDHPIYGDGFSGGLTFEIDNLIPEVSMYCTFGKLPTYKYWAIDVEVPVLIPVAGGISLTQLMGGLSYHMENTQTVDAIINASKKTLDGPSPEMSPDYIPNEEVGIGFRAGVGYRFESEKTLNGEMILSVEFNASGGLRNILLAGDAYMMVKKAEREEATNYAKGTIAIGYDNVERILDAQFALNAQFAGAFTADIWSQLYLSPDLWYFHLGTPSDQCAVNLYNFASANAYFMFGQNLPPMAPPPPQVSGVLGGLSDGRNEDAIALGDGIGTGMNLYMGFDASLDWLNFSVYANGYVGAGFDMTLYKYSPSAYCSESGEGFGANYWYLQGQLYAYGSIGAGVAGTFAGNPFDVTIISASMAMLLEGRLPKPAYIYGGLYLQASLFSLFELDMTVDFDAGTECTIVD